MIASTTLPTTRPRTAFAAAVGFLVVAGFQVLLALGLPLGRSAWGGDAETLTPDLRFASVGAAVVLVAAAGVTLGRAGIWGDRVSRRLRWPMWLVVAGLGLSAIANLASGSAAERALMAPVALGLAGLSFVVARGAGRHAPRLVAPPDAAAAPEVRRVRRILLVLALPPFLFLGVIAAFSVGLAAQPGADDVTIAAAAERLVPQMLLVGQLAILGLLLVALRRADLGVRSIGWRGDRRDVTLGLVVGVGLAVLYLAVLSPLMVALQESVGDIVPPGSLLTSFGMSLPIFFAANVLLAPFVEESLYRGFGLLRLTPPWSGLRALLVTSALFGLLHWSGGVWYILITGAVAGLAFGSLALARRNLVAPFVAHLVLNLLEFLYVASLT